MCCDPKLKFLYVFSPADAHGRPINSSHSSFEDAKHRFNNDFNTNDEQTE
jgi:hypothetical protein